MRNVSPTTVRCVAAALIVVLLLATAVPAAAQSVVWTVSTPGPCTAPTSYTQPSGNWGGITAVIFGCPDGTLTAVAGSNGTTLWTAPLQGPAATDPTVGPDGFVYVASATGYVASFDPITGTKRWSHETAEGIEQKAPLAVCNGKVFVGDTGGNVHCLDAANGEVLWSKAGSSNSASVPSPYCYDGLVSFAVQGGVVADNAETSSAAWPAPFRVPRGRGVLGTPVGLYGNLFYPVTYGGGGDIVVLASSPGKLVTRLPIATGGTGSNNVMLGSYDDTVLATTATGSLVAIKAHHGNITWTVNATNASFTSAAVSADARPVTDSVFIGASNGLYNVGADGSGYVSPVMQTTTPVTRPPIPDPVNRGIVYFATQRSMYAVCAFSACW